ncbi:hypothetical protein Tco_1569922 [Tanacetum coccineum]
MKPLEMDSFQQGRKFSDEEIQEKASADTKLFIQEVTPTEFIQDQEGSGKASDEATLVTAGGTVTYSRRSAEKRLRKDKGKAILIEEEPKKKSKKELEQEQLSYAEAIRLEEQWTRIKELKLLEMRRLLDSGMKKKWKKSYGSAKPIFEKIWDFNQNIKPMDEEQGSKKQKSPKKERSTKKIVEEEAVTQEEREEVCSQKPAIKEKEVHSLENNKKRQKLEEYA